MNKKDGYWNTIEKLYSVLYLTVRTSGDYLTLPGGQREVESLVRVIQYLRIVTVNI